MVDETYCGFRLSEKLMEKGFDGNCHSYWLYNGEFGFTAGIVNRALCRTYGFKSLRPTYAMVMAWLRDECKIGIFPCVYEYYANGMADPCYHYGTAITNLDTHELLTDDVMERDTFEEAVDIALEFVIDRLDDMDEYKKLYNDAIYRARKVKEDPESVFYEYTPKEGDTIVDYIFPELNELGKEDKGSTQMKTPEESLEISTDKYNDIVHDCIFGADDDGKVREKPTFNVGDWIVHDMGDGTVSVPSQIRELTGKSYVMYNVNDQMWCGYFDDVEDDYRLWTIHDARDGDVLASHEDIVIFKEIDGLNIKCHCTTQYLNVRFTHLDTLHNKDAFVPATYGERKILFRMLEDEGYAWDDVGKRIVRLDEWKADKIESGKWYKCIKTFVLRGKVLLVKDKFYKAVEERAVYGEGGLFVVGHDGKAGDYFRPATENELGHSQGVKGDANSHHFIEETDDDAWLNDIICKLESGCRLNNAEITWMKSLTGKIVK
ncbi:MAG: hypothetical protein J6Y37_14405 [Paludibacteraceae bacterium]|nr:hypothetical protein [Paludibacteraceae bacterium]